MGGGFGEGSRVGEGIFVGTESRWTSGSWLVGDIVGEGSSLLDDVRGEEGEIGVVVHGTCGLSEATGGGRAVLYESERVGRGLCDSV